MMGGRGIQIYYMSLLYIKKSVPPTCMRGSRPRMCPQCRVAGSGTAGFYSTTGKHAPQKGRSIAHVPLRPAGTFMPACLRPPEAACFLVQKRANNRQLIVASIQSASIQCAARFRII